MFINNSKTAKVWFWNLVGGFVGGFFVAVYFKDLPTISLAAVELMLVISVGVKYEILKRRENKTVFMEAFGIDPSKLDKTDPDECANVQTLINRVLRQKAWSFAVTRKVQQECLSKRDGNMSANQRCIDEVRVSKRDFWGASDAAKYFGFSVLEKHTDWLNEPASAEK